MEFFAFLGGFLAVGLGIGVVTAVARKKLQRFFRQVFGIPSVLESLSALDLQTQQAPRSLNGCDTLLIPRILADFPDFDPVLAKTYVRSLLKEKFGSRNGFTIHNVVMARYLPSAVQKTIVFQAAVSWLEDGNRVQKRFDIHYGYLLTGTDAAVAANCPNCGGALGYGVRECPYCGSRVAGVMGNSWAFTEIQES